MGKIEGKKWVTSLNNLGLKEIFDKYEENMNICIKC
jgi:hypothetical protein